MNIANKEFKSIKMVKMFKASFHYLTYVQKGFSLFELLIVIVIIGIVSAVTVPPLISSMPNYRLKGAVRELASNFKRARIEALKRKNNVSIEFINPVVPAATFNPPGGQTGDAYRIFVDDGAGGGVALNGIWDGTELLITVARMPKDVALLKTAFTDIAITSPIGFNSRGMPFNTGTVELRNSNLRRQQVRLSAAGHIRIEFSIDDGANYN